MDNLAAVMQRAARLAEQNRPTPASSRQSTPPISDREAAASRIFQEVVPAEYAGARPESVPQVAGVPLSDGRYGACFAGETGIGKTYAATALAWRILIASDPEWQRGIQAWRYPSGSLSWMSSPYLLARIRGTFNRKGGEREKDIIDECIRARVFVLDDLGAEKQSEFGAATLYTILSGRRNWRRYTIVTTNQPLADIAAWEPRVASRMGEMTHVVLPKRDRRLAGKGE